MGSAEIVIKLHMEAIKALQLAIDSHTVKWSILDTPKLKLKADAVRAVAADTLLVSAPDMSRMGLLFGLEQLMSTLPKVSLMILQQACRCSSCKTICGTV